MHMFRRGIEPVLCFTSHIQMILHKALIGLLLQIFLYVFMCLLFSSIFIITDYLVRRIIYFLSLTSQTDISFSEVSCFSVEQQSICI